MSDENLPLAVRLRPRALEEFVGQSHILGEGRLLRRIILSKKIPPLIFHGPPGTGKTTLGFIIANGLGYEFKYLNAAFSSVAQLKKILLDAKNKLHKEHLRTILFIDEIHRFNKLQQEALVPDTETASITFIAATIYNPSYYLIRSLVSRSVLAEFKPLTDDEIIIILKRALKSHSRGLGDLSVKITNKALDYIAINSSGDARKALSSLEIGATTTQAGKDGQILFDLEVAKQTIQKNIFYDKKDNLHYDTISAFIKSVRGSDPDSALYWLAKMIVAGEDPRFIARRLVILASEDIGNANPFALVLATSAFTAVEFIGNPEAGLVLAQATIYLAASAKSNSCYRAISAACESLKNETTEEVPRHLKTHAKDYKYPHDSQNIQSNIGGYVYQNYGAKKKYYFPKDVGEERKLKEFLSNIEKLSSR